MAIVFVDVPGECRLAKGLGVQHEGNGGFLAHHENDEFFEFEHANGPGKQLETYLHKSLNHMDKLRPFLTPPDASVAAAADFETKMAEIKRNP
eukprot:6639414-Pyramimonas_sp.AAC.1